MRRDPTQLPKAKQRAKLSRKKSAGPMLMENLTIKEGKRNGQLVFNGMNLIVQAVRTCVVALCQKNGVTAYNDNAHVSYDDLQVEAYTSATITLSGEETSIQENGASGGSSSYGLDTVSTFGSKYYTDSTFPPKFNSSLHSPKNKSRPSTVVVETGLGEAQRERERERERRSFVRVVCFLFSIILFKFL